MSSCWLRAVEVRTFFNTAGDEDECDAKNESFVEVKRADEGVEKEDEVPFPGSWLQELAHWPNREIALEIVDCTGISFSCLHGALSGLWFSDIHTTGSVVARRMGS